MKIFKDEDKTFGIVEEKGRGKGSERMFVGTVAGEDHAFAFSPSPGTPGEGREGEGREGVCPEDGKCGEAFTTPGATGPIESHFPEGQLRAIRQRFLGGFVDDRYIRCLHHIHQLLPVVEWRPLHLKSNSLRYRRRCFFRDDAIDALIRLPPEPRARLAGSIASAIA
jgi:hypothetical protein